MSGRTHALRAAVETALFSTALAAAAVACPPSLTVAPPARGAAGGARGAFVVIHAIQGCHPGALTVSGTAEGLVGGERRSVTLSLEPGPADVFLVSRQWPSEGVWVLRLTVSQSGDHATALVGIGPSGRITSIRQPTRRGTSRPVADADIEAMLRTLAAG